MISSITIRNFKSYRNATLRLAPLTFLIGANASGKSNALEAIRIMSWLAKGKRLDDIAKSVQGGDAYVRGQARDLFRRTSKKGFFIGFEFDDMPDQWNQFGLGIGLLGGQLVVSEEYVTKVDAAVSLYRIDGEANTHTDEISIQYNNFKRGKNKPHIPCSNRQAIFYQLETPSRFAAGHDESQRIIPEVASRIREELQRIIFIDPRPSLMRS